MPAFGKRLSPAATRRHLAVPRQPEVNSSFKWSLSIFWSSAHIRTTSRSGSAARSRSTRHSVVESACATSLPEKWAATALFDERLAEAEAAREVLGASWRVNLRWPDRGIDRVEDRGRGAVDLIRQVRPRTVALPVLG